MRKELSKEIPFGKATAIVTVVGFTEKKYSDGIDLGISDVIITSKVKIVKDGTVLSEGYFAKTHEYNSNTNTFYERFKLDKNKKYTTVGDKAITLGDETGKQINTAIEDIKTAIAESFGIETETQKQKKEDIEYAQSIVKQAEIEGVDKLMTAEKIKAWRNQYNDLYNEGGQGYLPTKISKEAYERAIKILNQ